MSERILGKVVLVCVAVLCASCAGGGRRGCERAYASDDVRVFLAGFRQAVSSRREARSQEVHRPGVSARAA